MKNDDDHNRKRPDNSEGGGGFNWKGFVLLFSAIGLFAFLMVNRHTMNQGEKLTYSEFEKLVREDKIVIDLKGPQKYDLIVKQSESRNGSKIEGYYLPSEPTKTGEVAKPRPFSAPVILPFYSEELKGLMKSKNLEFTNQYTEQESMGTLILSVYLPFFIILALLIIFFRHQIKSAGRGAMSFGKSKAKLMTMDKNKITFSNVAGIEEAKDEVWEIVEYLRDPKKFQRLGGKIPKGVLMVGSPGTGKTLLARAIAGEADVPFFSISGSDFVEMFVGVGASRVRDMFEQGKKNAPCLIFIDEIDAVGRHRGHGLGGGHDEREQTLNALLVEMDGFDTQEGVIIIAATNRPDVLDPALLRPGRFDRQITVNLPDVNGREQILKVHAQKIKLAEDVNLGLIARGTPGYSGAELANVINEAALLAARRGLNAVTIAELEEARDKVRWGKERRSLALSEDEKQLTAYHEAGHALLGMLVENADPVHKVTIIPRGPALGVTMYLPEEDKHSYKKNYCLDWLVLIMGGRVAEELVFKDITNGASGDIRMATNMARKMVCHWGMSEELGMVEYGEGHEQVFLARDITSPRNYSEATAQKIDKEVKRFTDEAYQKARKLIAENLDKLETIAQALLEYETIDGAHMKEIMQHGRIINPPSRPMPPDFPGEVKVKPKKKASPAEDGDFGDLAPVGA